MSTEYETLGIKALLKIKDAKLDILEEVLLKEQYSNLLDLLEIETELTRREQ